MGLEPVHPLTVLLSMVVLPLAGTVGAGWAADRASGGRRMGLTLLAVALLLWTFCGAFLFRFALEYGW